MGRRDDAVRSLASIERSEPLRILFSPAECDVLEAAAAEAKRPLRAWIREAALEKAWRLLGALPVDLDDLEDVEDPEGIDRSGGRSVTDL